MSGARLRLLFRALQFRNYRLFVAGQGISLVGTWMQQVAMSWLIYRLTGSAHLLGVIGFTGNVPSLILTPLAGVLADRWDRRRLLMAIQMVAMLQAAVLAAVVFADTVRVWQLIVLSVFLGAVNAFDMPVRQSFVVEMVDDREYLGNAIALNSTLFNMARLVGPSLAGIVVAVTGEGVCFLINSLSFLGVLSALAAMRLTPREERQGRRHVCHELRAGFSYAFGFGPIRSIILLVMLVSLAGMPYAVLMPVFARDILRGGAATYGFLMAAVGSGALVSTLFLASRRTVLGLGRLIWAGTVLFSLGLAVCALSTSLPLSLAALSLAGFGMMMTFASCNTVVQTIVEEEMRGRVMGFHAVAIHGIIPFGSLLAGSLSGSIGARQTLLLGSLSCLAGAVAFSLHLPKIRENVRPIYQRLGILPRVAEGMRGGIESA